MLKEFIIFTCGCVVGAAIAAPLTARYISKKDEERYKKETEGKDKYIKTLEERAIIHEKAAITPEDTSNEEEIAIKRPDIEIKKKNRLEGKKILTPPKIDYTTYYQQRAENEHPREEDDVNYIDDDGTFEENKRIHESMTSGKKPKIVSEGEYWSPEYEFHDKIELNYFTEDEILATPEGEVVENSYDLIGNALTKYGFSTNDEQVIFVRNFEMSQDYEIDKVFGAYADSV